MNSCEKIIEDVLTENYGQFYRLAYGYVRNEEDALDIVQESAYKAIKEAEKLKNPAFAKTWIYRIVINTAISQLRKKRETVSLDEAAEIAVNASYGNADLQKALSGLTDEQKTLIRLRFFEDMKLEEIAMVMDENPNTITFKLIDNFLGTSGKGFVIFWLPPVFQATILIKGSTIGIKGVGNFMSNDRSNSTVVS